MKILKRSFIPIVLFILILLNINSCTTVEVYENNQTDGSIVQITDSTSYEFHLSKGEIGVLIDTRPIFTKGYIATKAEISFPDFQRFNTILDIDEKSNVAIFSIDVDSLTVEEKESFNLGINALIEISNDDEQVLSTYEDNILLDYSNTPLMFYTNNEFIPSAVVLKEETPYVIMFEIKYGTFETPNIGVLTRSPYNFPGLIMDFESFDDFNFNGDENSGLQKFFFQHVGGNKYKIRTPRVCQDVTGATEICDEFTGNMIFENGWFGVFPLETDENQLFISSIPIEDEDDAAIVELIPSEDGWNTINLIYNNESYPLTRWENFLVFDPYGESPPARIRIVANNIEWNVESLGTIYHHPVVGPTQLDFAYQAILRNCSSATLSETVGNVETKTQTSTFTTSESFSLFSGEETTIGLEVTIGVEAKVGAEAAGGSLSWSTEVQGSYNESYTTNSTYTEENTFQSEVSEVTEVSRIREVNLLPYSSIEIMDAVKKVTNVRVPYVLILKITGYNPDRNIQLSGEEIVSQLKNNLFSGYISEVESNHVEITIRGSTLIDDFFKGSTVVQDIPGCD